MAGRRRGRNAAARGLAGRAAGILLAALAGPVAGALEAQELPPPDIGLVGGTFSYDLGVRGDATSPFGGLRVRFPLSRHFLVEPGLAMTRLTADSVSPGADRDITFLLMEFQAQVQVPVDRVRPHVGVGAGGMLDLRGERGIDEFMVSTYSVAAGVAVDLGSGWAIRTEVRGRAIDDDAHSAFELGLALSTTF